ncbi:NAD-dependent protein deacetylase sirtuin-6-like [Tropilaelaps mercedesae]|uniref:protein acetyllysine N-acetyltransferase n=1 Tax=Tropilaelaps mercedesae TaxID=418985 RepID=A0A1V9WZ37_9ACAR|nr:NAD-dependent protein deacetylase sirtuin-6-like [Tropilaelaps mercedesae]
MSCDYANGLSPYEYKGKCGQPEVFDSDKVLDDKVSQLADWVRGCGHMVVITGAGISTSAGIPDFRGPNGVWTKEQQGEQPTINVSFDDAVPTKTHMALVELQRRGKLQFICSQNVDGLHTKSGFPLSRLTDVHGNMFVDRCQKCGKQFIRRKCTRTVGQKLTGEPCLAERLGRNAKPCRGGRLRDSILDWEDELPTEGLNASLEHCRQADLVLCLGSTLQILPVGTMPLQARRNNPNAKIVLVNLQDTKLDKKCDLKISYYVDTVMEKLFEKLDYTIPDYSSELDPTKKDTGEWVEKLPRLQLPKKKKKDNVDEDQPKAKVKRGKAQKAVKKGPADVETNGNGGVPAKDMRAMNGKRHGVGCAVRPEVKSEDVKEEDLEAVAASDDEHELLNVKNENCPAVKGEAREDDETSA